MIKIIPFNLVGYLPMIADSILKDNCNTLVLSIDIHSSEILAQLSNSPELEQKLRKSQGL